MGIIMTLFPLAETYNYSISETSSEIIFITLRVILAELISYSRVHIIISRVCYVYRYAAGDYCIQNR